MAAPNLASAIQLGIGILNTVVDAVTGTILAITGDAKSQSTDADNVEWWQQVGFASRPSNPAAGQASAEGFVVRRGDRDACVASRDVRGQQLAGNLQPGEACVYAGGADGNAQARIVLKANGSIAVVTNDSNAPNGNTIYWRLTPTEERFFAPWGTRLHDATGYHLKTFSGARLDMGGIGLPAPLNAFGSYATISADIITLDAAALVLGRDTGNAQPVTLATNLLAYIATLAAALQALQTAIAATNASAATATGYTPGTSAAAVSSSAAAVNAASAPPTNIQAKTSVN